MRKAPPSELWLKNKSAKYYRELQNIIGNCKNIIGNCKDYFSAPTKEVKLSWEISEEGIKKAK